MTDIIQDDSRPYHWVNFLSNMLLDNAKLFIAIASEHGFNFNIGKAFDIHRNLINGYVGVYWNQPHHKVDLTEVWKEYNRRKQLTS